MRIGLLDFRRHLPTAELFGLAGVYRRMRAGACAMGASYQVGGSTVAVRLWQPVGSGQVHYLIDDDIEAGMDDQGLPDGYRRRLGEAYERSLERVDPGRIATVIVPSARLEEKYDSRGFAVVRMDPAWDVPEVPDFRHFEGGRLKVACLATRSHVADIELLREALEDPTRDWEFHHFMGAHAPEWMRGLSKIVAHRAMSWGAYRRFLRTARFHVCVYPMLPTAFNLARSCNKVMEHAMVGGASLFSACVPFAGMVEGSGVLIGDGGWMDALREISGKSGACEQLARAGHRLGRETAQRASCRQKQVWQRVARGEDLVEFNGGPGPTGPAT